MPFFIFILSYTLGALLCTFIAISLNKTYKWITIKDITIPYEGDILKFILILGIIFWPLSIFTIGVMKCVSLFITLLILFITLLIEFCKDYIPKE